MRRCGMLFSAVMFVVVAVFFSVGQVAGGTPKATIIRDNYGVPHVYSATLEGLFFGYGYATAQDRLFEMEMFRRTFWGRLSEVLGEKLLPFDQGNRRDNLSLNQVKHQIEGLTPELQTVLRSYAAGVDAFISEALADPANKLPKEFHEFDFRPEPWTAEDVAADFLSVMGFFMDVSGELANASVLQFLSKQHGPEKGQAIFDDWCWGYDPESPTTIDRTFTLPRGMAAKVRQESDESLLAAALQSASAAEASLRHERQSGRFLLEWALYGHPASYAVILSPQKSSTGVPQLMGGPQFGYQLPSALHEVGLHGAGIDVVGSTLTGYPFIMFGHNRRAAFSSTAGIDNIEDIYTEKLNPANLRQYWYKGAWRDMEVRSQVFKVKGKSEPVVKEAMYTVHGPVFFVDEANHVAFSKRLSCKPSFLQGLASFYDLMKAETVEQFNQAAQKSDMSINYFFATIDGDIAYYHLGLHPIRPAGYDMRLPAPGTGDYEWLGFLPKSENPHGVNPESGYIVNWNNQPAPGWGHADLATSDVWGGWGRDDRVSTLIRLIASKEKHSPEDLKAIIKNIAFYDKRALNTKDLMIDIVKRSRPTGRDIKQSLDLLAQWDNLHLDADRDGFYDHPGAAIFDGWWAKVVSATFGDEFDGYKNVFGQTAVQILSDRYHGYTFFYRALQGKTKVDYFGGRKAEILQASLQEALSELDDKQKDKRLSDYRLKTAMDAFHPVSVLGYFLRQPITTSVGQLSSFPKVDRGTENHIVNLESGAITGVNITAPGTSGFISPSGQRSKHLDDQVQLFVNFDYKPILFYKTAVERSQSEVLKIEMN